MVQRIRVRCLPRVQNQNSDEIFTYAKKAKVKSNVTCNTTNQMALD